MNCISLRRLSLFSLRFGLSTAGFRSSIGTNGTIGTNRMTWHSIGTPLVNCISLRGLKLFSPRFGSSTVGFRVSIGTNGTIGTIERFHSRDYRPYWFTETKKVYSQRFSSGHQHGRHFFVLGHQHGRRDVM